MNVFESKRLRLITKSPIHIGSVEQKITRFDFIHNGQYIYPISEDRLSLFLQKKNLISHYVAAVEREGSRFNLAEFFKSKAVSLKLNDLETLSNGRKIKVLADASRMQEFRPLIRDGFSVTYLPGTSIKGVIRTALLYNHLKTLKEQDSKSFKATIEDRISNDIANRVSKRRLFQWANEKWLEGFILQNKSKSPNTDWFRMLHISDAYPSKDIETVLIPANILKKESRWNFKEESFGQKTNIWVECIPENSEFDFEATWDRRLLEDFRRHNNTFHLPNNLETILAKVRDWATDIFNFERTFSNGHALENWYRNNPSTFRIGFGSGMVSTTIAILLSEDLRKKVRNYAGINRGNDIAPKSRRVWIRNNIPIPFGWAVIEVL